MTGDELDELRVEAEASVLRAIIADPARASMVRDLAEAVALLRMKTEPARRSGNVRSGVVR